MWRSFQYISPFFYRQKQSYSSKAEETFIHRIRNQERQAENNIPEWKKRDLSLKKRYGSWNPTRKLSRQHINDIRALSTQMPHLKTVDLAKHYKISPEAVRRILSSTWIPKENEEQRIIERGEKRKAERRQLKEVMINNIETARSRITNSKSINLNDMQIEQGNRNLREKFSKEGKFKYDSNNNHGFYNRKSRKKKSNPFSESVGDMIE